MLWTPPDQHQTDQLHTTPKTLRMIPSSLKRPHPGMHQKYFNHLQVQMGSPAPLRSHSGPQLPCNNMDVFVCLKQGNIMPNCQRRLKGDSASDLTGPASNHPWGGQYCQGGLLHHLLLILLLLLLLFLLLLGRPPCTNGMHIVGQWCSTP